jgi:protein-disulfide isomerase
MESNDKAEKEIKKLSVPININTDHVRDYVNAPLNIVEYGDYECPYTAAAYPIVKKIINNCGKKFVSYLEIFHLVISSSYSKCH